MTEEEKIAQQGKPKLGDIKRITIRIKESMEFKVEYRRTGRQWCSLVE